MPAIDRALLLRRLMEATYVGEVDITEQELNLLVPEVKKALCGGGFVNRELRESLGVLLIFAANCAYHDFDEDGFWPHFFRRVDQRNEPGLQDEFGRRIELALQYWMNRENDREGPWRYVGAVLEETGITKGQLGHFAEVIGTRPEIWMELVSTNGGYASQRAETTHAGQFLRFFLNDPSGSRFVTDVGRLLLGWNDGRFSRDDLNQAQGFRPGFFGFLLDELSRLGMPSPRRRDVRRVPKIRILFDERLELPGVAFDLEIMRRGSVFLEDEPVFAPFVPISRSALFKQKICLNVNGQMSFLEFWTPSSGRPYGLFHVQLGFFPHRKLVQPGRYILVGQGSAPPPYGVTILTDFNFMQVEDAELRYWVVEIVAGLPADIPGYKLQDSSTKSPSLQWVSQERRLERVVGDPAFIGHAPAVSVSAPELFGERGSWAIFVELAGERTRIRDVKAVFNPTKDSSPKPPFEGRVWIERIGRGTGTTSESTVSELRFVVLPEITWYWPCQLHAPQDEPEFGLRCSASVQAAFEGCEALGAMHWRAGKNQSFVLGDLSMGSLQVSLACRLYRSGCWAVSEPERRDYDVDAFCKVPRLQISGYPNEEIHLAIALEGNRRDLLRAGAFDKFGHRQCAGVSCADALRSWQEPVGFLEIKHNGRWIRTDTRLFQSVPIEDWLAEDVSEFQPVWFKVLSELEQQLLVECRRCVHGVGAVPKIAGVGQFSPSTVGLLEGMVALAQVFQNLKGTGEEPQLCPRLRDFRPAWSEIVEWVLTVTSALAKFTNEETISELLHRYEHLSVSELPRIMSWHNALQNACESLRRRSSFNKVMAEWGEEVRRPGNAGFRSALASLPGGRELTHAYRDYFRSHHVPAGWRTAIATGQNAVEMGESVLVRPLGMILCALIRRRSHVGFDNLCNAPQDCHPKLIVVFDRLRELASSSLLPSNEHHLPELPLPDDDLQDLIPRREIHEHP